MVYELDADVIGLQETKAQDNQVQEALSKLEGYEIFSNSAERKGYSGTAILTRKKPLSLSNDIGIAEHDAEGRVITTEFNDFYLVNTYVPNSGGELARLDYRQTWDAALLAHLQKLEAHKPVVLCGDLNVAHRPIDLARPEANYNRSAGFTEQEIAGLDNYLNAGYIDTFRTAHPDTVKYSWWSYRMGARKNNIGWRIDYFLASEKLKSKISNAFILNEFMGSDHCPVGIEIEVE
jgi:exodeoxyribonuclease-3